MNYNCIYGNTMTHHFESVFVYRIRIMDQFDRDIQIVRFQESWLVLALHRRGDIAGIFILGWGSP